MLADDIDCDIFKQIILSDGDSGEDICNEIMEKIIDADDLVINRLTKLLELMEQYPHYYYKLKNAFVDKNSVTFWIECFRKGTSIKPFR